LAESSEFHATLGIFYMPKIYDMGQTALLPLRRKSCWRFFSPWKIRRHRPGLNPRTWVLKASTQPVDHRSRLLGYWYPSSSPYICHSSTFYSHVSLTISLFSLTVYMYDHNYLALILLMWCR
jgi:hypothetical protein